MTNEAGAGDAAAALYLADVVERFDRDGLTVERAVVESGHGGRLVFDGADADGGVSGWSPVFAGWRRSRGWDVLLADRQARTRRITLGTGAADPPPGQIVAAVRRLVGARREPAAPHAGASRRDGDRAIAAVPGT